MGRILAVVTNQENDLKAYKKLKEILDNNGYHLLGEGKPNISEGFDMSIDFDSKEYLFWSTGSASSQLLHRRLYMVPINWMHSIIYEIIETYPNIDLVWILSRLAYLSKSNEFRYEDRIKELENEIKDLRKGNGK